MSETPPARPASPRFVTLSDEPRDSRAWGSSGSVALALALAETKFWAMRPDLVRALGRVTDDDDFVRSRVAILDDRRVSSSNGSEPAGNVAVVSLHGVMQPQPSLLDLLFGGGGGGLNEFLSDLRSAVADPGVRAVVLDLDSPGGLVDLVPEAAAEIRGIRDAGNKPIVAVANTQAASAAYWLASQANEVIVTPSGEVGSIGVYALHRDMSGRFEQMGVKHTLISAGKYKTEGNPYEPLSDEALAAEQESVNDYYDMFVDDVAAGRQVSTGVVRDGYGEGRSLTAERAVTADLADRVATLGETVRRMSSGKSRVKRTIKAEDEELVTHSALDRSPQPVTYTKEQRLRLLDALVASR